MKHELITPQHTVHQVTQWPPEVFPNCQPMLVNKQDIVLEARVEMRLEPQVDDNGIVMAVDVRIHAVQTLKDLAKQTRERLRERDTCFGRNNQSKCHQNRTVL